MSERDQLDRWRCTVVGCNPVLKSADAVGRHQMETGHRTAKWPIRSAEGKRRARIRNRTGYYDKYNVGEKSAASRALGYGGGVRFRDIEGGDTAFGEDDF